MKECGYCHAENEDAAHYCSACGAPLAAEKPAQTAPAASAEISETHTGVFTDPPSPETKKNSGFAIASLVLGAVGFFFGFNVLLGVFAIVFAALAFEQIKRENKGGKGLAAAGLILGILSTLLGVVMLVVLLGSGFQTLLSELQNEISEIPVDEFSDIVGRM